jgi:hypothetical protein
MLWRPLLHVVLALAGATMHYMWALAIIAGGVVSCNSALACRRYAGRLVTRLVVVCAFVC